MKSRRGVIIIAVFLTITLIASPVWAVYHPSMGRFLQRDPGQSTSMHVSLSPPARSASFIPQDQYDDGMHLYQYIGAHPIRFVDPLGLARIRIGFRGLGPSTTAGEQWHETLIGTSSQMYNWNEQKDALRWLFQQIDKNSDRRIDNNDIQGLDLGIHGFSQGGIAAIELSRTLGSLGIFGLPVTKGEQVDRNSPDFKSGWIMCVKIPVKALVTIDPASFAFGIPKPRDNVKNAVNYYQQRGGNALLYSLDSSGNTVGSPQAYGTPFSASVKGNKVDGATIHRIDTRAGYRDNILGNLRIHAKDVNHDTIPWYVAPEAVTDLQ